MFAKTSIVLGILLCVVLPLVPTAFPDIDRRIISTGIVVGAILLAVGMASVLLFSQLGFTPDR